MIKLTQLTDLLTVARASEAGFTDAAGQSQFAAQDTLRRDFDPATRAPLGALIEPARTNLLLHAAGFDETAWTRSGGAVTLSGGVWTFDEDTTTGAHGLSQSIAFTASEAYVVWADLKHEGDDIRLVLPDAAFSSSAAITLAASGSVALSGSQSGRNGGAIDLGDGWWRVWLTAVADVSASGAILLRLLSGGTDSYQGAFARFRIIRAQTEQGTWPSTAIRTTTAAATRSADAVTASANWIRPGSGTIWIEATARFAGSSTFQPLWTLDDGTANNAISLGVQSGLLRVRVTKAGTSVLDASLGALASGEDIRVAIAWGADGLRHARIGTAQVVAGVPVPFGLSTLRLAANSAAQSDIALWLRRIVYWPASVDSAGIANLTAPPESAAALAAGDSLSGRALTVTATSVTGWPVPTVALDLLTLDGVDVSGDATGTGPWTFTVPDSASAQTVAWRLTATNARGTDTVSGSEVVAANLSAPVINGVPTTGGTEAVGSVLTATAAPVTGTPTPTRAWQWKRGGVAISGATSATYTLVEADEGETLTVVQTETNAIGVVTAESTATGTIAPAPPFSPLSLFAGSVEGSWYDIAPAYVFQNSDGTGAVSVGDPVGYITDRSGNGNHLVQATASRRGTLRQTAGGEYYIEFDGIDDRYQVTYGSTITSRTMCLAFRVNGASGVCDDIGGENDNSVFSQVDGWMRYVTTGATVQDYSGWAWGADLYATTVALSDGTHSLSGTGGTTTVAGSAPTLLNGLTVGAFNTDYYDMDGRLYSMVDVGRALTAQETSDLENYIKGKAGIV